LIDGVHFTRLPCELGRAVAQFNLLFLFIDLFVLFVQFHFMQLNKPKSKKQKRKSAPAAEPATVLLPVSVAPDSEIPAPDAFLEEAKNEPKRKLISDHIRTINTLREEKRFTFRAIAEWLTKRGIETDHSSVYRAYLAAIPEDQRDPDTDWEDVDMPD
jgi:hypothetical protein